MRQRNVIYEIRDGIGFITLNRPEKLNAINDAMLAEIDDTLADVDQNLDVKVAVLSGAGDCFSSGQDLSGIDTTQTLPGRRLRGAASKEPHLLQQRRSRRAQYLFNLIKPTIARVHGQCLGLALDLAVLCDITVAGEDAVFGDPSLRLGILPDMPLWVWLVGFHKAKELLFSGRCISGKEAERIGLINKAVPAHRLEAETLRLAGKMALAPGDGLAICKDAINGAMEMRGLRVAWRFTDEMQTVMQQLPGASAGPDFHTVRKRKGLKTAIQGRDSPFQV
ncbi:MAG: enoyl-CoA hydratase/isomerase family protein [Chloroflexota bacterium]